MLGSLSVSFSLTWTCAAIQYQPHKHVLEHALAPPPVLGSPRLECLPKAHESSGDTPVRMRQQLTLSAWPEEGEKKGEGMQTSLMRIGVRSVLAVLGAGHWREWG